MDKIDEEIKEVLSQELDVPNHYINTIKNFKQKKDKTINKSVRLIKVAVSICMCVIITTGIVFATKDYITEYFGLGKGIDTAVENGYIENVNMDYIESNSIIYDKNIKINTKIEKFLMDDMNLSVQFDFDFKDDLDKIINLENLKNIELKDLIVTDEENRIIYSNNKSSFEVFCTKNNLPYKFREFNENYMNNGLNSFINNIHKNQLSFTYNMYTDGKYPKSKELNFYFTQIELKENYNSDGEEKVIILKGNWNIVVDVPEKMYNRQTVSYKVVSCSNNDFSVTTATLYETGFEVGVIISNIKKPDESKIMNMESFSESVPSTENNKFVEELNEEMEKWRPIHASPHNPEHGETYEDTSYIENEKGEKFEVSISPTRRQNGNFVEDDKFEFYETFTLTKYEATDKLKVVLLFKGVPVIIDLQKI